MPQPAAHPPHPPPPPPNTHVKEMLHEYLRRVLLNKPDDPIAFLMDEIKRNPFVIPTLAAMPDDRPEEEKAKYIDARPIEEKMSLLKVRGSGEGRGGVPREIRSAEAAAW